jgi:hypothetical protein
MPTRYIHADCETHAWYLKVTDDGVCGVSVEPPGRVSIEREVSEARAERIIDSADCARVDNPEYERVRAFGPTTS